MYTQLVQNYRTNYLNRGFHAQTRLLFKQAKEPSPPFFPLQTSPSTQVRELCQKQPNAKHSQQRSRESKLWEGTRLTSEGATCEKFLPNYWECTGSLYKNAPVHIHVEGGTLFQSSHSSCPFPLQRFHFLLLCFLPFPLQLRKDCYIS